MKHILKILLLILLWSCKREEENLPPCSSRYWKLIKINSKPNETIQDNISEATFGDTNYDWKNTNNELLESGTYTYDSEAQIMTCTPAGKSFITKKTETYQMQSILTDKRLTLTYQKVDTIIVFELEKNCQ